MEISWINQVTRNTFSLKTQYITTDLWFFKVTKLVIIYQCTPLCSMQQFNGGFK